MLDARRRGRRPRPRRRRSAASWPRSARAPAAPVRARRARRAGAASPISLPAARAGRSTGSARSAPSGVRSRGITLRHAARAPSSSPRPTGPIRFAGPFRDHDGIVIIDHGGGWTSLIINVAPSVAARRPGRRRRAARPRARRRSGVELSPERAAARRRLSSQVHLDCCQMSAKGWLKRRHDRYEDRLHDPDSPNCFPRSRWSARSRWCR